MMFKQVRALLDGVTKITGDLSPRVCFRITDTITPCVFVAIEWKRGELLFAPTMAIERAISSPELRQMEDNPHLEMRSIQLLLDLVRAAHQQERPL